MRCFARWEKDDEAEVFFRDQTVLQFGESWELIANLVLLNPGSALPLNGDNQTDFLRSKNLPFFVEPIGQEKYVEFSVDRLMNDVLKLFSSEYGGGTIRLYNLFNLKNQYSGEAIQQFSANESHPKMLSKDADIRFCDAPVVIASGGNAKSNPWLKSELVRHIGISGPENVFAISRSGKKEFSIMKARPNSDAFVESYHPSYTFKYGNSTNIGDLRN